VPRAATTSDVFNAIAEPRRREILAYLALRERPVSAVAAALDLNESALAKHPKLLRRDGLA